MSARQTGLPFCVDGHFLFCAKKQMIKVIKDIVSSISSNDNKLKKGALLPNGLIKSHGNGVFINGAGIYVDDLIWVTSTEKMEDINETKVCDYKS